MLVDAEPGEMTHHRRLSNGSYIESNWSSQDAVRRAAQLVQASGGKLGELKVWTR